MHNSRADIVIPLFDCSVSPLFSLPPSWVLCSQLLPLVYAVPKQQRLCWAAWHVWFHIRFYVAMCYDSGESNKDRTVTYGPPLSGCLTAVRFICWYSYSR